MFGEFVRQIRVGINRRLVWMSCFVYFDKKFENRLYNVSVNKAFSVFKGIMDSLLNIFLFMHCSVSWCLYLLLFSYRPSTIVMDQCIDYDNEHICCFCYVPVMYLLTCSLLSVSHLCI